MTEPKYKVGDLVLIRDDLKVNQIYGSCKFTSTMEEALGKFFYIASVHPHTFGCSTHATYSLKNFHEYSCETYYFSELMISHKVNKWSVGDVVRVKDDLRCGKNYNGQPFVKQMMPYKGGAYIVDSVVSSNCYKLKEYDTPNSEIEHIPIHYYFTDMMLEDANEKFNQDNEIELLFTLNDLQDGDFVQLRDQELLIVVGENLIGLNHGRYNFRRDYTDDLTCLSYPTDEYDVVKVWRGCICTYDVAHTEPLWSRPEPVKMTLKQVCEALGQDIVIVDE